MGNPLIGKTLAAIQLAKSKQAIKFILSDGSEIVARAFAECCSYTYIEHISLPASGFPALVLVADDVRVPNLGTPPGVECVRYYGFELKTDKGNILLEYRNESNGHYGGDLLWPDDEIWGGGYVEDVEDVEWADVTQDL